MCARFLQPSAAVSSKLGERLILAAKESLKRRASSFLIMRDNVEHDEPLAQILRFLNPFTSIPQTIANSLMRTKVNVGVVFVVDTFGGVSRSIMPIGTAKRAQM